MKILRILNQNRISVIVSILIVIFVIVVIQIINAIYRQKDEKAKMAKEDLSQTIQYKKESETIISDTKVTKENGEVYGGIIENFLNYCVNGKAEKAYEIISKECKDMYYKTFDDFKNTYYKDKFSKKRKYKFQSWIAGDRNVYQIQLYDDILSLGKSPEKYIIDYYTVVKENGENKLNINNFIGIKKLEKEYEKNKFNITVKSVELYKDYFIFNFRVKNDTTKTIKVDGRENTNSVYVKSVNGVKFKSQLYELLNEDLIVKPGVEKDIKIKFNIVYRDDLDLDKIVFSDIIMDYDNYKEKTEISISI